MRIGQVFLTEELYGSERYAIELADALAERHEVSLLVRRMPNDSPWAQTLRRWLRPEIPVIQVPRRWPGVYLRRAARHGGLQVVHCHHNRSSRHVGRWLSGVAKVATLHVGYRDRDHRRCDLLICPTEHEQRTIRPSFKGQSRVVANWVRPHRRLDPAEIAALRARFGIGSEHVLVGSVGRLVPDKGFDLLIEAFRQAALPAGRLVILGDGAERARLVAMADHTVLLPGFQHDVRDYYQALDVFVSPSRREPFGLAILEAMDAGLPLICTMTSGAAAILADTPVAWVPTDDVQAMAAALRRACAARPGRRRYDLSRFSLDASAAEIEALYAELLSPPS
jgi:glycosyltransferase involved in cell wall biosynthesis